MSLSADKIRNYYEFKALSSVLKKKYPFVLGVELSPDYLDYDLTLYLSLVVDFDKLFFEYLNASEDMDTFLIDRRIETGAKDFKGNIHSPVMTLTLDTEYDDKLYELFDEINEITKRVHKSESFEREHKIPKYHTIRFQDISFPLNTYKKNAE